MFLYYKTSFELSLACALNARGTWYRTEWGKHGQHSRLRTPASVLFLLFTSPLHAYYATVVLTFAAASAKPGICGRASRHSSSLVVICSTCRPIGTKVCRRSIEGYQNSFQRIGWSRLTSLIELFAKDRGKNHCIRS